MKHREEKKEERRGECMHMRRGGKRRGEQLYTRLAFDYKLLFVAAASGKGEKGRKEDRMKTRKRTEEQSRRRGRGRAGRAGRGGIHSTLCNSAHVKKGLSHCTCLVRGQSAHAWRSVAQSVAATTAACDGDDKS